MEASCPRVNLLPIRLVRLRVCEESHPHCWERATPWRSWTVSSIKTRHGVARSQQRSKRNRDQGVEAAAVADHDAFGEAERARGIRLDLVAVAAGGEHVHVALAHDAHDQERRLDLGRAVVLAEHDRQADDVAIALALVDVDLAQGGN